MNIDKACNEKEKISPNNYTAIDQVWARNFLESIFGRGPRHPEIGSLIASETSRHLKVAQPPLVVEKALKAIL